MVKTQKNKTEVMNFLYLRQQLNVLFFFFCIKMYFYKICVVVIKILYSTDFSRKKRLSKGPLNCFCDDLKQRSCKMLTWRWEHLIFPIFYDLKDVINKS